MKIVHACYDYDESLTREEDFLARHYTITGWAESLQQLGNEVVVISRHIRDATLRVNNVRYIFLKDDLGPRIRWWHSPRRFFKAIRDLDADIIHLHNLALSIQTFLLRRILGEKTSMVIQHHGGPMPPKRKRLIHHFFNKSADAFFFTTVEHGREWLAVKKPGLILPVMEGASYFNFNERDRLRNFNVDRNDARRISGMTGSPIFLWAGRLDQNKDPLTVLAGFESIFETYPNAKLYMIFSDSKILDEVKNKINNSELLRNNVSLIGKLPHEKMEEYYWSADYFVLGSHYEGSGYALSEALSCGCVPVITGIPSFRMMTDEGKLGALWKPGDKASFVAAVHRVIKKPLEVEARACIDFYKRSLSYEAIGRVANQHYKNILKSRNDA